jgi:hypothetical protein
VPWLPPDWLSLNEEVARLAQFWLSPLGVMSVSAHLEKSGSMAFCQVERSIRAGHVYLPRKSRFARNHEMNTPLFRGL